MTRLTAVVLACTLALAACGKRGDPVPPAPEPPAEDAAEQE